MKNVPADRQPGFWTSPENIVMKESVNYEFVDHPTLPDHYSIKLLGKPYPDVIYTYGNVRVAEIELEDGEMAGELKYAFRVDNASSFTKEDLMEDEAFKNYIGDVLENILSNQEYRIGDQEEYGEN